MDIPTISLDSLVSDFYSVSEDLEPMLMLAEAEIILGQDCATQMVFVVDGKQTLEQVIGDVHFEPVNVVVVELDRTEDDLRQLRHLIDIAKSR